MHQLESCLGSSSTGNTATELRLNPIADSEPAGAFTCYVLNVQFNISVLSSENKTDQRPRFMLKGYSQENLLLGPAFYASFFIRLALQDRKGQK